MWKHVQKAARWATIPGAVLFWLSTNSVSDTVRNANGYIYRNLQTFGWQNPPAALATEVANNVVAAISALVVVLGLFAIISWKIENKRQVRESDADVSSRPTGINIARSAYGTIIDNVSVEDCEVGIHDAGRMTHIANSRVSNATGAVRGSDGSLHAGRGGDAQFWGAGGGGGGGLEVAPDGTVRVGGGGGGGGLASGGDGGGPLGGGGGGAAGAPPEFWESPAGAVVKLEWELRQLFEAEFGKQAPNALPNDWVNAQLKSRNIPYHYDSSSGHSTWTTTDE